MLVTNHVLSGAVIGAVSRHPLRAFVAGVASHFVLDATPHWGKLPRERFLEIAVRDGLTGLAAIAVLAAIAPPDKRLAVLAGMAGAALPDLDKPSIVFFGKDPFPRAVQLFHNGIQNEAPDRAHHEVAAGVLLGAAALMLLRGPSRRASRKLLSSALTSAL